MKILDVQESSDYSIQNKKKQKRNIVLIMFVLSCIWNAVGRGLKECIGNYNLGISQDLH